MRNSTALMRMISRRPSRSEHSPVSSEEKMPPPSRAATIHEVCCALSSMERGR
jgi:hypothetical protein